MTLAGLLAVLVLSAWLGGCSPQARDSATPTPANLPAVGPGGPSGPVAPTASPAFPPTSTPNPTATSQPTEALPTPDPWDGKGRVTVLVMGVDYADWANSDRAGPPRSDSMILLTIDPATKTAGMLSIPRDLWVSIPGIDGENKINTAYRFGELYNLPGGGPELATRTVEHILGIPINFYVKIDFTAFEDFINEIHGVKIYVQQPITVTVIGSDKKVTLDPGWVTLPGDIALAYVRDRYTANDDFDRSARQQQVILAIRDRILSFSMLPTLVLHAPALYRELSTGLTTNMSLSDIIQLAWLAQQIQPENIRSAVIGPPAVTPAKSADGEDILLPNWSQIQAVMNQVFTSSTPGVTNGMSEPDRVTSENARIEIIDESGSPGLGQKAAAYLQSTGLNVVKVTAGTQTRPLTRVIDQSDEPFTLRRLIDIFKIHNSEIYVQITSQPEADLVVYLGEDAVGSF